MIIPPNQNTTKDEGVSSLEVQQRVASVFKYSHKRTEDILSVMVARAEEEYSLPGKGC